MTQSITSICLCETIPINFDYEIYGDITTTGKMFLEAEKEKQLAKYPQNMTDRFLVLGLSKGAVAFLQVDDLELIYARLSLHR